MVLLNIVVRCASPDRSSSLPSHSISRGEERKQNKIRPEAIYIPRVCALSRQLSTALEEKTRTFSVPKEIYGHLPKQRESRGWRRRKDFCFHKDDTEDSDDVDGDDDVCSTFILLLSHNASWWWWHAKSPIFLPRMMWMSVESKEPLKRIKRSWRRVLDKQHLKDLVLGSIGVESRGDVISDAIVDDDLQEI